MISRRLGEIFLVMFFGLGDLLGFQIVVLGTVETSHNTIDGLFTIVVSFTNSGETM